MAFCWQHPWLSIALMPHFGSTMPFPKVERILFTVYNYFSLSRIFFFCNFKGGRHCMSIEQKYSIPSTFPIWFVYPSCLLLTAQVPFISPFIWTPYQLGHLHQDYPKLSKTAHRSALGSRILALSSSRCRWSTFHHMFPGRGQRGTIGNDGALQSHV